MPKFTTVILDKDLKRKRDTFYAFRLPITVKSPNGDLNKPYYFCADGKWRRFNIKHQIYWSRRATLQKALGIAPAKRKRVV